MLHRIDILSGEIISSRLNFLGDQPITRFQVFARSYGGMQLILSFLADTVSRCKSTRRHDDNRSKDIRTSEAT